MEENNEMHRQQVISGDKEKNDTLTSFSETNGEASSGKTEEDENGGPEEEENKTCESLVDAIMADVAVQCNEKHLTQDKEEMKEKATEKRINGPLEKEREGEVDEGVKVGTEATSGRGRGRKKRKGDEWKGRRETKRKKKVQVVSLQDVRTRKPTLLEKVF